MNVVDDVYFRHLPDQLVASNAQAALLPSLIFVWLFGGSLGAISVGTQAITARRYAERKYDAAGAVLANAIWFCLVGGIFTSILAFLLIPTILERLIPVARGPRDRRLVLALAPPRRRLDGDDDGGEGASSTASARRGTTSSRRSS